MKKWQKYLVDNCEVTPEEAKEFDAHSQLPLPQKDLEKFVGAVSKLVDTLRCGNYDERDERIALEKLEDVMINNPILFALEMKTAESNRPKRGTV